MLGYKVPAPDEAMLVSGGRIKSNAPFRVVTGHGAFILPVFRKARFLTLAMCEAEVAEKCVTQQGITLNVRAVIAFKVGNDTESIISAAQRFLSDQDQMAVLTGRIFAGHLAVDHRLDDRRADHPGTPEAGDRGPRRIQGGDGPDRADRRRPANPVHRRRRARLHQRDVGTAQRRHPAAGADRAGAGEPEGRRSRAGVAAPAGRVRPSDRHRQGQVQGRGRQGPGASRPGRAARRSAGPARGAADAHRTGRARRRAAPAGAGRRGGQARRGRGRARPDPGRRRRGEDEDPGRGGGVARPGGAGQGAHRPAARHRGEGGPGARQRERDRAQRRRRAHRGGQRTGRAGQGDLRRPAGHRRLLRRRKRRTADRHQLRIRLDQPKRPTGGTRRLPDNGGGHLVVVQHWNATRANWAKGPPT